MTRDRWCAGLLAAALVCAVWWLYEPVADHEFLEYDDGLYVTAREEVQRGFTLETLRWALTSGEAGNWHPLAWWSHALDVEWFGLDAGLHHRGNVAIHAAVSGALLLTLFAATASLPRSALVAGLFALHPQRVESVAWVAERKDVLCGLFFVLTIAAYTAYSRRSKPWQYGLVLLCSAAALMSKAMAVTLPAVLLLLDHWPLRRSSSTARRWLEKLPLFAMAGAAAVAAIATQDEGGALSSLGQLPLSDRIQNALTSYLAYLRSAFWPDALSVFYPRAGPGVDGATVLASGAAVAALVGGALWLLRARPPVGVGMLWFFGTLVPVIGLVAVGEQARADRYTYLPSIGLAIALVWGIPGPWLRSRAGALVAAAVLVALAATTRALIPHWRNDETLFAHALAVGPESHVAHLNYATAIGSGERRAEQRRHLERSLELSPDFALTHYNLGRALVLDGEYDRARDHYLRSLVLDPDSALTWNNFGALLTRMGQPDRAVVAYRRALGVDPEHPSSLFNLAMVLTGRGELDEARGLGWRYLEIRPQDEASRLGLAGEFLAQHEPDTAVALLESAPDLSARAQGLFAIALWQRGSEADAIAAAERAHALAPHSSDHANDLAWMLAICRDDRLREPERALRLALAATDSEAGRRDPELLDTLAAARAAVGEFDAAAVTIAVAIERAREGGRRDLIPELEARQELYRVRVAFRREDLVRSPGSSP